ncbi:unnamed protein product [Gongylonema pulchrum]|uniref:Transposase n=1 Tax=Gongylonema pulchrum TaxID=637853 RepID=A0A183D2F1_9BILA|nr:unnamed protein product [Gongylonema pulchrum]
MLSVLAKRAFYQCQTSPFLHSLKSRFGWSRNERYRRRLEELKRKIEQKSTQELPYQKDLIPVRPPKDLWKACGFTVGLLKKKEFWGQLKPFSP